MNKNFDDFKPQITIEMYLNATNNDDKNFNLSKVINNGEITLDLSEFNDFLLRSSAKLCLAILRQYHDWNNLD